MIGVEHNIPVLAPRWAPGPVRQIRAGAGRAGGVRARRQRRDGNLDQLPRHQDHADRRDGGESRGDRQTDRAVDRRTRTPGQLGDPRLCGDAGAAPRRLCATAQQRAARCASCPGSRGQGRELLRLSRTTVTVSGGADFSRDLRFTETSTKGVNYAPAEFRGSEPDDVDLGVAFRFQCRHHRCRYRPRLPLRIPRRRPGRQGHVCLCGGFPRPGAGEFGQGPGDRPGSFQIAAGRRADDSGRPAARFRQRRRWPFGADRGQPRTKTRLVSSSSSSRPRRRWRRSGTSCCGSRC